MRFLIKRQPLVCFFKVSLNRIDILPIEVKIYAKAISIRDS